MGRIARWIGAVPGDLTVRSRAEPVRGSVVGVFGAGCYVRSLGRLFAVGAIPPGPLHLVVTDELGVSEGAPARVCPDRIVLGEVAIDLARAVPWAPRPPGAGDVAALARRLAGTTTPRIVEEELHTVWGDVSDLEPHHDLGHIVDVLAGRGPGLTPIGDDVAAGILLSDAWTGGSADATRRRVEAADAARTSDLSRSFLRWAARGQSIEPVHRLPGAARLGTASFREAVSVVEQVGASSGQALLAGLALGLRARS